MVEFLILWTVNVAVIALIIRWRGVFSAEGYALSFLGLAVAVDGIQLVFIYLTAPETLPIDREFTLRVYPTIVHVVGLLAFAIGLGLADPRPAPVARKIADHERAVLARMAICVVGMGVVLHTVAVLISGATLSSGYLTEVDTLRWKPNIYGGFWYRGAGVMMLGLAVLVALPGAGRLTMLTLLVVQLAIATMLVGGKGSLVSAIVFVVFIVGVYNRDLFFRLMRPSLLAVLIPLGFLGVGFKSIVVTRGLADIPTVGSLGEVYESSVAAVGARYSYEGLYRRYASMIEYLSLREPNYFAGFQVGLYTLTSWVPRFLYPDKPDHPYRGIDFMMNPEGITYFPEGNDAPTLVGWAFSDGGLGTAVIYLLIGGAVIGTMRRVATVGRHVLCRHLGYVYFTLQGGVSSEAGLLPFLDVAIFTTVVIMGAWIGAQLLGMAGRRTVKHSAWAAAARGAGAEV